MPATILRPVSFMENYANQNSASKLERWPPHSHPTYPNS
jgi:hypothetical protein